MRWVRWSKAANRAFNRLGIEQKFEIRQTLALLRGVPHYPVEAQPIGDGFYRITTVHNQVRITFRLTTEHVLVSFISR